ncbi:hypothetical protein [Brevifollis gellanilyticus]|uniref:hypothetical protein n=1 Tax=Brevifollis gellanilyticus TaxID=748831 RepID=UPI0011BE198B|nr:hypothetical protein [Brevifollis gellanilyticus]
MPEAPAPAVSKEVSGPVGDWVSAATLVLPTQAPSLAEQGETVSVLPERQVFHKGLAAMVVNQCEKEAPPFSRRPPITSPFPATTPESMVAKGFQEAIVAASVPASPASAPSVFHAVERVKVPEPAPLPEPQPLQPDPARQELQDEIEQVKNDLFGAVMGVSALKDRLDGLEAQLSRIQTAPLIPAPPVVVPAAGPSRSEVESLISSWMETHLSAAVERFMTASQKQMMSSLSTLAFFRAATPLGGTDRQSFLAQPPVVLTATPV